MTKMPQLNRLSNNCSDRIKPTLLRDVKTEALLVLARTALERYFAQLEQDDSQAHLQEDADAAYVYEHLHTLLQNLQKHVVNVDYLINLVQKANQHPQYRVLLKREEPLMEYYDIMAQRVKHHFDGEHVYLPVFLVICVLSGWILDEEKSIHHFPFLEGIDFLELMGKFEEKREQFKGDDGVCKITQVHELAFNMVEKLKQHKYKVNKKRVSKKR